MDQKALTGPCFFVPPFFFVAFFLVPPFFFAIYTLLWMNADATVSFNARLAAREGL